MFVSTRSPTLLALFLLMVTIQPYHLLLTEQSSHVPSLSHQMKASNFDVIHIPNHTLHALLGSDADACFQVISGDPYNRDEGHRCRAYQVPWLDLILEKGVHSGDLEYTCKDDYLNRYCNVLIARAYCQEHYFEAFRDAMKQEQADAAQKCSQWLNWQPPLDSVLMLTREAVECEDILEANGTEAKCHQEVNQTTTKWNIKDPTEFWCKREYEKDKCAIRHSCKNCAPTQVDYFLDYVGEIWSPKLVECTKWASGEPIMNCSFLTATTQSITTPQAGSCLSVLDQKGIPERCDNESQVKYPDLTNLTVEMQCRAAFYSFDCGMKAACEQCSDTKDYVDYASKTMDSNAVLCKPWSSEALKLQCPTSHSQIFWIVGISIGLIAIVALICLLVYLCFTSPDKSERQSTSKGSKRCKPKCSTPRSRNKAGSSMGAKQTSRAAAGTKKQSSRMTSCGPVKKHNRASKGAKPRSRVKQSKRSRASALK